MMDWIGVAARSAGPWLMTAGLISGGVTAFIRWLQANKARKERNRRIAAQDAARRERLRRLQQPEP